MASAAQAADNATAVTRCSVIRATLLPPSASRVGPMIDTAKHTEATRAHHKRGARMPLEHADNGPAERRGDGCDYDDIGGADSTVAGRHVERNTDGSEKPHRSVIDSR